MQEKIVLIRNAAKNDFGGGERFSVLLAKFLLSQDYSPILLTGSDKTIDFAKAEHIPYRKTLWWHKQNWSGINTLLFPVYCLWQMLLILYYTAIFLRLRARVVHIQSKDDFIAATLAAKICRARVVWTDHADLKHIWRNAEAFGRNPVGKLVLMTAHLADAITLVSNSEADLIKKHVTSYSIRGKFTIIYNGCSDRPELTDPKRNREIIRFCFAGRLVKDKGIRELIVAYKKISSKYSNIALEIIGDGRNMSMVQSNTKDDKSVTIHGHIKDPLPIMSTCDVFIQPTYHEGFSIALVEASMLGMGIIATNVGGNKEIIKHNHNGILIPIKDISKLILAMEYFINNVSHIDKMGRAARRAFMDNYVFENIVLNQIIPLYNKDYENKS